MSSGSKRSPDGAQQNPGSDATSNKNSQTMWYDEQKVDEAVLALLFLAMFEEHGIARAWKSHDWDSLGRLHEKGLIGDPKNKNKSLTLTPAGIEQARECFEKLFGRKPAITTGTPEDISGWGKHQR